jgi:hypothetical protein
MQTTPHPFPQDEFEACGHSIVKIELSHIVITDATFASLANQLMDAARSAGHGDTTTVWIAVVSKQLPDYLERSISYFEGFGIGLIVTHGDKCSHSQIEQFPDSVLAAIKSVNRDGRVWHPLENRLVAANPF